MILALKRSIKLAWLNFKGQIALSLVAVLAIAITIIFLTLTLVAKDFGEMIFSDVQEKMAISLYFKEEVDEETILATKEELVALPDVQNIQYVSKQRALESFIERHRDNPALMAALAEVGNPFLSFLSINSETTAGFERIIAFLEESPSNIFFEKIDYAQRKEVIEQVFQTISIIERVGLVIAIIMSLVTVLVVFNMVKLAIYGMKEEISIMRLVGVSKRFIASSFVFQGAITGLIGLLIGLATLAIIISAFGERIAGFIPGLNILSYISANISFLLIVQFSVALVLGIFSSLIAINKYLKI